MKGLDALAAGAASMTKVKTEEANNAAALPTGMARNGDGNKGAAVAGTDTPSATAPKEVVAPAQQQPQQPLLSPPQMMAPNAFQQQNMQQHQYMQDFNAAAAYNMNANINMNQVAQAAAAIFNATNMQKAAQPDPSSFAAMQHQFNYYQYLQSFSAAAAKKASEPSPAPAPFASPFMDPNQAFALAFASQASQAPSAIETAKLAFQQQVVAQQQQQQQQQVVAQQQQQQQSQATNPFVAAPTPAPLPNSANAPTPQMAPANSGAMQPPVSPNNTNSTTPSSHLGATATTVMSEASVATTQKQATHLAPMPSNSNQTKLLPSGASSTYSESSYPNAGGGGGGDKKEQKRAANRRSAQLSRKRKKRFIEELREENDDLRRKEQILRSIPDLIVVFDSAGKLWFVSRSVSRFLEATSEELEGTSFWECLCEDSVRLLKAAFMDALAARKAGMDTTPLGEGVWELRLVDKDGTHKVVTLNGVVHFSGDAPECVCSIRPRDEECQKSTAQSTDLHVQRPRMRIEPHQSVINNSDNGSVRFARGKASVAVAPAKHAVAAASNGGMSAARISDPDSGSAQSESGSEE